MFPVRLTLASRSSVSPVASAVLAGIVALAGLVSGGRAAEASCGDWLAGHQRSADSPAVPLADVEARETVTNPRPADLPRWPHCDGPACRGVPFLPVLPRESPVDAPRLDPADLVSALIPDRRRVDRPSPAVNDALPPAVIAAVPIRPPRWASLQA